MVGSNGIQRGGNARSAHGLADGTYSVQDMTVGCHCGSGIKRCDKQRKPVVVAHVFLPLLGAGQANTRR